MTSGAIRVEPLDRRRHRTDTFTCGNPALDCWLDAYAGQAQRNDVARSYVAIDQRHDVVGYYTLVAGQIEYADAPDSVRKGVSRHFPIPIVLIARLAVATSCQRRGLGTDLLRDALLRILAASEQIGVRAVLVHAIDQHTAAFYQGHGFEPATPDELTLMVPIAAVRTALAGDPNVPGRAVGDAVGDEPPAIP